jgi:hypothetical protein
MSLRRQQTPASLELVRQVLPVSRAASLSDSIADIIGSNLAPYLTVSLPFGYCYYCVDASGLDQTSLSQVVLLCALSKECAQGKVVLLTAAWLPSDKVRIPLQYRSFTDDSPATPPSAQQHLNPLGCSCVLLIWASTKCLRPRTILACFIPLTFLIPEASGYQAKIPQTALCHHREASS